MIKSIRKKFAKWYVISCGVLFFGGILTAVIVSEIQRSGVWQTLFQLTAVIAVFGFIFCMNIMDEENNENPLKGNTLDD